MNQKTQRLGKNLNNLLEKKNEYRKMNSNNSLRKLDTVLDEAKNDFNGPSELSF